MKIREFTKELLSNTKYSFKRFPLTLIISFLLVAFLIILNENIGDNHELMSKISLITGLGIPVSILIQLIDEVYLKNIGGKIISYLVGGGFLLFYYFIFLSNLNSVASARYVGVAIFLILACTYIQRIKNKYNYEKYILAILNGGAITGIYSIVLYLGIVFIVFSVQELFEVRMIYSIYYYIFLIVTFIFAVSMFLSKYPKVDFKDIGYPKAFKVLLLYIIIPLVSIYTLILYIYFLKIMITWEWPSGLVSHLVIWYSTISVFVIFFIIPILEENNIAKSFRKYFPIFNIPVLAMMFLSIGQRIVQYGFTENRYYILLLGIWILTTMIHYLTRKPKSSTFILISLSAFILISTFGPLSSFNIAIRSQNNRLNALLDKNNILVDGELTPNRGVLQNEQIEISNIISYFVYNHDLSYVESLPEGYNLNNMVEDFGFIYSPSFSVESNYFHYSYNKDEPIDIRNYDYSMSISTWGDNRFKVSDLDIYYNSTSHILTISRENEDTVFDIIEYVRFIHYESEEMTILIESEYNIKLIFSHISGSQVSNSNDMDLHDIEFMLLLDYKN